MPFLKCDFLIIYNSVFNFFFERLPVQFFSRVIEKIRVILFFYILNE